MSTAIVPWLRKRAEYHQSRKPLSPSHTASMETAAADAIEELQAALAEAQAQDEIHWKTRRTLVADLASARGERDQAIQVAAIGSASISQLDAQVQKLRAALEAAPAPGEEPGWRYKEWRKWCDTIRAALLCPTCGKPYTSPPPVPPATAEDLRNAAGSCGSKLAARLEALARQMESK